METNIGQATYTGMKSIVPDYSVTKKIIDESTTKNTYWENPYWTTYLGYYKQIPELKKAIDALAMWTAGKGWIADTHTTHILEAVSGWGEDSFDSIMQNMIIVKKVNGDSFAEIIKYDDIIVNLKPLNPSNVRIEVNEKGIITGYQEYDPSKKKIMRSFKPEEIFHLSNDRVANEIHGTSVIEACKWVIDARNEAMADWRRILHRSTIRILYVDAEDTTRLNTLKNQYAEAIKYGEVLVLPSSKDQDMKIEEFSPPPITPFLETIKYYENFFYQALGVPKVIMGGTQDFTEAASKVGYMTFDQVWMAEQRLLEQDIMNQLAFKVKFERPTSLKDEMQSSEAANTGQVGFQPNEINVGMTRNE